MPQVPYIAEHCNVGHMWAPLGTQILELSIILDFINYNHYASVKGGMPGVSLSVLVMPLMSREDRRSQFLSGQKQE